MNLVFARAILFAVGAILTGCEGCSKAKVDENKASSSPLGTSTEAAAAAQALESIDIKVGTGAEALDGKKLSVLYDGKLSTGVTFDSRKDKANPFEFVLGSGLVIAGWEQGVKGMREGGIRRLVIPPHLAYGERPFADVIPPHSTLTFEIELLKVD